jgi:integrase
VRQNPRQPVRRIVAEPPSNAGVTEQPCPVAVLEDHLLLGCLLRWPAGPSAGGVLDNTNFRRNVFTPSVRALGLGPFTPHDLRHTTASLAVSAGANVKAVQRLLGHASAAMTLDIYASLFDDDLDRVAERLNDAALRDQTGTNAA